MIVPFGIAVFAKIPNYEWGLASSLPLVNTVFWADEVNK